MGVPLLTGSVIFALYLLTHSLPAQTGGMYLLMGEKIASNNFLWEMKLPITETGTPFPYPPLGFYLIAVLLETGLSGLTIAKILPGLLMIAYLPLAYLIGVELFEDRRRASFAAALVSVSPQIVDHHIAAGGMVRSLGFLFALGAIFSALRLYGTRRYRWLTAAGLLFGLSVLTHPMKGLFAGLSIAALWLARDRTRTGFRWGILMFVIGCVVASPWIVSAVQQFGVDVFLHSGGSRSWAYPPGSIELLLMANRSGFTSLLIALTIVGALYRVLQRKPVLPVWLGAVMLGAGVSQHTFFVGAFIATAFLWDAVLPSLRDPELGAVPAVVFAFALVVHGVVVGGAYVAGVGSSLHQDLTQADTAAMEWVENETRPNASFVVAGPSFEWFPYLSNRTILLSPWGSEWSDQYGKHSALQDKLSSCWNASCVNETIDRLNASPEYVYVQRSSPSRRALARNLAAHYERAYRNEGVSIFRVETSVPRRQQRVRP